MLGKKNFLLIVSCLMCISAFSQADSSVAVHHFIIKPGYQFSWIRDVESSSLQYYTHAGMLDFTYEGHKKKHHWFADVHAFFGAHYAAGLRNRSFNIEFIDEDNNLQKTEVPVMGTAMGGWFYAGWMYDVKEGKNKKNLVSFGLGLKLDAFYPKGYIPAGLMAYAGFYPSFRFLHRSKNNQFLQLDVDFALLGAFTRLPYHRSVSYPGGTYISGLYQWNTGFAHPFNYMDANGKLTYYWMAKPGFGFGISYQAGVRNDNQKHGFSIVHQQAGIIFIFQKKKL